MFMFFLIFLVIISIFLLAFSISIVETQSVNIIERFGKFVRIQRAGLNFRIPFIERIAGRVSLRVQQLDIVAETKTRDNVFVHMKVSVQFLVEESKAVDAFYKLTNARAQMESYVFDVIRSSLPRMSLDESFENKDAIALDIKKELSEEMSTYGYTIIKSLVVDINPEENVKRSMNEINAAQRQLEATKAKAEAEKLIKIKEAEGQKESMKLLGEGIAEQRKAIARGLRVSIEDVKEGTGGNISSEYISSLVMMYQYLDTLENMTKSGKSNVIFTPNSPKGFNNLTSEMISALSAVKDI
ncbi:SPFH domain-containing protein [Francisella philomiragia]|uniref:SPFH domain-containing protein n=1 Tax=Francisella philomiragia TaxID=28110 RepID=UPI0015659218|nr:SPFH domain-containing protein [Francisella philomiragia]MBK2025613.1 SPFH domain-containing protein [Francisella philomiragia]MBK2092540.1 SPFH domain-containing protein [Francisella philomiragia]MBK2106226.1 SPFH domain-containing protein [Francisella philomiragia]MBK2257152.1 SPFH domain-containing protein [Francisella philomiragia]MBK2268072.1 SPFH domain-containing protein [Francisella philomiragia]